MLWTHRTTDGSDVLRTRLLDTAGVRHAFSTRRLENNWRGSDEDFGYTDSDPANATASLALERYRLLLDAIGCRDAELAWVHQVHGAGLIEAHACGYRGEADGLLTRAPRLAVSVRAADCVPILLASEDGTAVAAVHAGWRGIAAGIVPHAVRAFRDDWGIGVGAILAAIGPCIGPDAFEVGPEVAEAFHRVGLKAAVITPAAAPALSARPAARPHIDLADAARRQLEGVGLAPAAIDLSHRCTYREADAFFSHRRDAVGGRPTGRMAAIIAPKP